MAALTACISPDANGIDSGKDFIISSLKLTGRTAAETLVIADEILSNIVNYGYGDNGGKSIEITTERDGDTITLTFSDSGAPFNPLLHEDPDTRASAEDRSVGGLGIFIVKKLSDSVDYEHKGGRNVLMIKKTVKN